MPIMRTVKGDLIALAKHKQFDVIVHGCNCQCRMRSGIAKSIVEEWPQVELVDLATVKGDRSKLGTYTFAYIAELNLAIINMYTQEHYGTHQVQVDYEAVRRGFTLLDRDLAGKNVGIPKIGAGLAGGNWDILESIITTSTPNLDITLVTL